MATTITIAKKEKDSEETLPVASGQKRATFERYRLQVDRQTKSSYSTLAAAEKAGAAVKKAYPIVQVCVYDAEESKITVL